MAVASQNLVIAGLPELLAKFKIIDPALPTTVRRIHLSAAKIVSTHAKTIVPKESGSLSGSIRPSAGKLSSRVSAGSGLEYGGVIHYGWPKHNIEPNPFLTDALEAESDQVFVAFHNGIAGLIRSVGL